MMTFAEIQEDWKHYSEEYERHEAEQIHWLLSRLIKAEARAMEAEFFLVHRLDKHERCNECHYGATSDTIKHEWTPADWEQEAERELREET